MSTRWLHYKGISPFKQYSKQPIFSPVHFMLALDLILPAPRRSSFFFFFFFFFFQRPLAIHKGRPQNLATFRPPFVLRCPKSLPPPPPPPYKCNIALTKTKKNDMDSQKQLKLCRFPQRTCKLMLYKNISIKSCDMNFNRSPVVAVGCGCKKYSGHAK